MNDVSESLANYQQHLRIAKKSGDISGMTKFRQQISNVLAALSNADRRGHSPQTDEQPLLTSPTKQEIESSGFRIKIK